MPLTLAPSAKSPIRSHGIERPSPRHSNDEFNTSEGGCNSDSVHESRILLPGPLMEGIPSRSGSSRVGSTCASSVYGWVRLHELKYHKLTWRLTRSRAVRNGSSSVENIATPAWSGTAGVTVTARASTISVSSRCGTRCIDATCSCSV